MGRGYLYLKMAAAGAVCCIGGPALMYWVTPDEEELFKKFNPDLQRRNLENREARQKNFDEFVTKLKEYSKSDKPIWEAAKEAEEKARADMQARIREQQMQSTLDASELDRRRAEIRSHSTGAS